MRIALGNVNIEAYLYRWAMNAFRDVDANPTAEHAVEVDFKERNHTSLTNSSRIARTSWKNNLLSGDYCVDAYDLALAGYTWSPFAFDLEDDSDGKGLPNDLLTV